MGAMEAAGGLLKKATSGLPQTVLKKAAGSVASSLKNGISLSNIRIPLMTNDPEVKKFIKEFGLENPENMIKFLVEGHFAQLECISEGFNDLKEIDLINSISYVKSAKREYQRALKNPNDKDELLKKASDKLDQGSVQLEDKAIFYIDKIREIDNRPKMSYFMKAKFSLKTVDAHNHCAKAAVETLIEAFHLHMAIAAELGWDVQDSVIDAFEEFKDKFLARDNCSLMHAYDDKAEEEFWLKIPGRLENVIDTSDALTEFIEAAEDDTDYDNIDFG